MKYAFCLMTLFLILPAAKILAQDKEIAKAEIEGLKVKKSQIESTERGILKEKVRIINERLINKEISNKVSDSLKRTAAEFHALNIDNRVSIINNTIALLQRNNGIVIEIDSTNKRRIELGLGQMNEYGERVFGIFYSSKNKKKFQSNRRLTSDFVFGTGYSWSTWDHGSASIFNKTLPSYNSNYYEFGWSWKYRINKNNNRFRLNFGLSYQRDKVEGTYYEGEKIDTGIRYFLNPDFQFDSDNPNNTDGSLIAENTTGLVLKSATKINRILIPVYFEVGPSRVINIGNSVRYSVKNRFRFGLGFYGGLNIGVLQKNSVSVSSTSGNVFGDLKFTESLDYNKFLFGLNSYIGKGGILINIKYDLITLYQIETKKYRNLSLGFRFDL